MTRWILLQWAAVLAMILVATWAEGATIELRLDTPEGDLVLSAPMEPKAGTNTVDLRGKGVVVEQGQVLALVLKSEEELRWAGLGPLYYTNGDPWRRNGGAWEPLNVDMDLTITHCVKPENEEECGLGDVGFPGLYAPPNFLLRVDESVDMAQVFEVTETGELHTVSLVLGRVAEVPGVEGLVMVVVGVGLSLTRRKP